MLAAILGSAVVTGLTMASATSDPGALEVQLDTGVVRGVTDGGISEWRGIPYAAPPVGALRWRPPAPAEPWAGVRAADQFAPMCMQPRFEAPPEGSEDCLYLNVSAPSTTSPDAALPVMVHLHPGSNWFGAAYDDSRVFVENGVIVVTLGYRLGVFGFTGHPALSAEGAGSSGEYGVLDQIAALRWVQRNIAGFGGDPDNVTLFGFSAGSFDAVAIAASPLAAGLLDKLAVQTESIFGLRGGPTMDDAESLGLDLAHAVRCRNPDEVISCLRSKPAEELVVASGAQDWEPFVGGRVLPASPLDLLAAQADPVPMLVGSNREEAAFWLGDRILFGPPYTNGDWIIRTKVYGSQYAQEVRELWAPEAYESKLWATVGIDTDTVYTCAIRQLGLASSGPVYRYLVTEVLDNDPGYFSPLRATHGVDDVLLWHPDWYTFSPGEDALAGRLADYWTNFAKTGNRNAPGLPDWPLFTASSERIAVFDEDGSGERTHYQAEQCAFADTLPLPFGRNRDYTPGHLEALSGAWPGAAAY